MRLLRVVLLLLVLPVALTGCKLKDDGSRVASNEGPPPIPAPPDVAAVPANAVKTPSGIAYKVITVGLGSIHPSPRNQVRVHYTGWTTDGKMFDSSIQRGQPTTFLVDQVIPGWTEMLQLMVVGEKVRVWIPGTLAYDNSQREDAPKGMLVFEIELLDIR